MNRGGANLDEAEIHVSSPHYPASKDNFIKFRDFFER